MSETDDSNLAQLEELFHQLVDLDEARRIEILAPWRRSDPELVSEVERLLDRADRRRDLSALHPLLTSIDDATGLRVGAYRLTELIGEGGMGEVYRAERDDGQYSQTVAVKLIRAGLATTELRRRFRSERQILARLEHPNIARLADGGMTTEGSPYLVMEYVEGQPITEFCDSRRVGVARRIGLFLTVCRAVAHAHRNLVVHRDLKPSNILVSADGEVKLLDFGIAKLLSLEGDEQPGTERTLVPMLTPGYASPEQVRGEPATIATDVYSLGLLLYELLSGRRAQDPQDLSRAALEHAICEEEPVRLSDALAVGRTEEVETRVSSRGASSLRRLRKQLAGDLDVIVATALRKEPNRRYASARSLAEDLERHVTGQPVTARPDTWSYRVGKFLGRHRLGVAASAAVGAALVVGLLLALIGLDRARTAEQRALDEAAASDEIVEYLVQLFQANDPGETLGETVTARDLLERGATRIDDRLSDRPAVQARLLHAMGRAYRSLGLYPPAIELEERRLGLVSAHFGPGSVETARALVALSSLARKTADYDRALDLSNRAIEILEKAAGVSSAQIQGDLAEALGSLAIARSERGQLAEAGLLFERALEIREHTAGPPSGLRTALNNLATLRWYQGEARKARELYLRALSVAEDEFSGDHPEIANLLNNLALVYRREGDTDGSIAAHERALEMRTRILDADHPDIAESLNNLGDLLRQHDQLERGRKMLERALEIRERRLGAEHDHVATTLNNLGLAHLELDDPSAARPLFERSISIFMRNLGPDHVTLTYPRSGLARTHEALGDLAAAEQGFLAVVDIRRKRLGDGHPGLASALRDYAHFLRNHGRLTEAEAAERQADGETAD
ncbi:MAG: serine/threonine-protein kinase [Thermoanaerobaculia bacterium]|nr:serine/threonine-protein kinase [Thermoanaerobaculia bacterium]